MSDQPQIPPAPFKSIGDLARKLLESTLRKEAAE